MNFTFVEFVQRQSAWALSTAEERYDDLLTQLQAPIIEKKQQFLSTLYKKSIESLWESHKNNYVVSTKSFIDSLPLPKKVKDDIEDCFEHIEQFNQQMFTTYEHAGDITGFHYLP